LKYHFSDRAWLQLRVLGFANRWIWKFNLSNCKMVNIENKKYKYHFNSPFCKCTVEMKPLWEKCLFIFQN